MEKTRTCLVCDYKYSNLLKTRIFKINDESIGDHCYEFDKHGNCSVVKTTEEDISNFIGRPRHAISRTYICELQNHSFTFYEMEHKGEVLERTKFTKLK